MRQWKKGEIVIQDEEHTDFNPVFQKFWGLNLIIPRRMYTNYILLLYQRISVLQLNEMTHILNCG